MNHKVVNNFLDNNLFNKFKNEMFSSNINWFYKPNMTYMKNDKGFFSHTFYQNNESTSQYFNDYIHPILEKLKCLSIVEVRANLMIKSNDVYYSDFHVDRDFKCNTAILYMNDCNGGTELGRESKINIVSEENKMLIFDSDIPHRAVSQTDVERRIVINFNYFSVEK